MTCHKGNATIESKNAKTASEGNTVITKKLYVVLIIVLAVFVTLACSACYSNIVIPDEHYAEAESVLVNPAADDCAIGLMEYLKSIYGQYVISGQYINEYEDFSLPAFRKDENDPDSPHTVFKANELQAVYSVTGEYPAMLGLDVSGIECGDRCFSVEQAIEWHNAGGIVTICWHWKIDNLDGRPRVFYTEETDFDLKKTLADKESERYKSLIADIDKVSLALKELADAGVPVLWRPLHEASGGWFWWGASGKKAYKELWNILYDRMTNTHKLNNLIWVYNGQDPDWYVGDDKCDIIGDDPYYDFNSREEYEKDPGNTTRFKKSYAASPNKMIMMSENDFVFDIDKAFESNTKWLTFCTWCREFVCVYTPDDEGNRFTQPVYSEKCTTKEELKKIYSDDRVLTLKDLQSKDK